MAVTDIKMHPQGRSSLKVLNVPFTSAVSQTNKVVRRFKPGYKFEIVEVQVDCDTTAATITADAAIDGVSVLAAGVTPVADAATVGTLATSRTARRGSAASVITARYTSNGSGAVTNGMISITYRPYPLNGEV